MIVIVGGCNGHENYEVGNNGGNQRQCQNNRGGGARGGCRPFVNNRRAAQVNDFSNDEDEEVFDNRHGSGGQNDYEPSYHTKAEIPNFNGILT